MTTLSKSEYLKAQAGLQTGFGRTTDFADPTVGTTVQSEGGIPLQSQDLPGQVFGVDQLPDPEVARAYGLAPQTIPEHLIIGDDDEALTENGLHLQGRDTLDFASAQLREELGNPAMSFDGSILPADEAIQSLTDRTGVNAEVTPEVDPAGVQKSNDGSTETPSEDPEKAKADAAAKKKAAASS